jgi:hypothetical protein
MFNSKEELMSTAISEDTKYMFSGKTNEEFDLLAAFVLNRPIRLAEAMTKKLSCEPMSDEWKQSLQENGKWWFTGFSGTLTPPLQAILVLRDKLLTFGGEEACMPSEEEDLQKILSRGQFWYGHNLRMMRGLPSQCHRNSAALWDKNRDKVVLATGYALTEDGMWRQHTWCVQIRPRKNRIVETTTPRLGYFGYVMNEGESEAFLDDNWM